MTMSFDGVVGDFEVSIPEQHHCFYQQNNYNYLILMMLYGLSNDQSN